MKYTFFIILLIQTASSYCQVDLNDSTSNLKAFSFLFQVGQRTSLAKSLTDFSKYNLPNTNSPKLDSTFITSSSFTYRFGTYYNFAIDKKRFFNIGLNYSQSTSNIEILNSADVNINNSEIVRRDFISKILYVSLGINLKFNKTIFNISRYYKLYRVSKMTKFFSDESKEIINLRPFNWSNYELSISTPLLKNEKLYFVTTFQNSFSIRYDNIFFNPLKSINLSRSCTGSIGFSYYFL